MKKDFKSEELEYNAFKIRKHIIDTIISNGEGHAGGALSSVDIIAVLYFSILNLKEQNPLYNDKFILSAGHKCLALYGVLVEKGIINEKLLKTYNNLDSPFPGHPDSTKLAGIDFSTGSLGHGLPLGCGFALAGKMLNKKYKTYVLMGDGEQGEGSNWEAAAFAAHNGLDNLVAIIDENTLQINGRTCEICKPTGFDIRYQAFGWEVQTVDGHDIDAVHDTLNCVPFKEGKPSLIVAKTVKGKGLSFMEDNKKYHHWDPDSHQSAVALEEINQCGKRWNG